MGFNGSLENFYQIQRTQKHFTSNSVIQVEDASYWIVARAALHWQHLVFWAPLAGKAGEAKDTMTKEMKQGFPTPKTGSSLQKTNGQNYDNAKI